jgi:type VI protein secretion system component Hcp
MISSYHIGGGGKPTESLSLNFEKIEYKQNPAGPPPPP